MRVFITGEKGFIGTNLIARAENFSNIEIVRGYFNSPGMFVTKKGEPCVHRNDIKSWENFFLANKIDVVIHNAAIVGTDVCALNAQESTLSNVQGTYNICRAAKKLGIPVCYMGTTVIYDTPSYQNIPITETSNLRPTTLYGIQKLASEQIVKTQTDKWMIIRPLFAYGGEGDMNSLIAKTIYAALNGHKQIDMFLNPGKIKDYMHVNDYCDAVLTGISTEKCWNDDFNVSVENPYNTQQIVEFIEVTMERSLSNVIKWHPETDYLGNHRLSSLKFRNKTGWKPKIDLITGIKMSYKSIKNSKDYDPLIYLNEAKEKNIDLTEFFEKQEI